MPLTENRVIIACAGSGKTTRLVEECLNGQSRRTAVITYTNNNVKEIVRKFGELNSGVPGHVDVLTWYGFLLRECARPYQRIKHSSKRIESLLFVNRQSARYVAEANTSRHYFANGELIYSDKIAKFVVRCEEEASQRVTRRLKEIYSDILIDEFQDLAGWDWEFIKSLMQSGIRITLVGDPRQHIYSTNPSQKNKKYLGVNVVDLIKKWAKEGLCELAAPMNGTYRCNQLICNFVNELWPGMDKMRPLQTRTGEIAYPGVFLVSEDLVEECVRSLSPQLLRYSKRSKAYGCDAMNFGLSKGLQFNRVVIVPTAPIKKYLETGDLACLKSSKDKLHVAITRARHSVGFVHNGQSPVISSRFSNATT